MAGAAAHPIYLTAGDDNPNGAQIRFLVDGAALADASSYVRVAYVFDGRDHDAVARARASLAGSKGQGLAVSYWQRDGRRALGAKGLTINGRFLGPALIRLVTVAVRPL